MLAASLAVLALALALRAIPPLQPRDGPGGDSDFHFAFIGMLRRARQAGVPVGERFLLPSVIAYPALYHWLLSFLPPAALRWVDRWSGLVYDGIVGALITRLLVADGAVPGDLAPALIGAYLIAPSLTLAHVGPRPFSLTPRSFAQLLTGLLIALFLARSDDGMAQDATAIAAAILLAGVLLSSKFGIQVLAFALPLIAILTGQYDILGVAAAAFAGAWIASRGYLRRQLGAQYAHLRWYWRHNVGFLRARGNWRALGKAIMSFDLRAIGREALARNPLLSGAFRNFLLIPAFPLAASADHLGHAAWMALSISIAVAVPWVLTSFGVLRILGEAERYLEFGFPAQWFLLFALLPGPALTVTLLAVCLLHLVLYVVNLWALRQRSTASALTAFDGLAQAIEGYRSVRLLMLDDSETYGICRRTSAALCSFANPLSPKDWSQLDRLYRPYPFINPDMIDELVRIFRLNMIVRRKVGRDGPNDAAPTYRVDRWTKIFENERYELFAIAGGSQALPPGDDQVSSR